MSYCLGLTDVDEVQYQLFFEIFLKPGRVSMPVIALYLCLHRRREMLDYVIPKSGGDQVAQILTLGRMAARAAERYVGRVMKMT